MPEYPPEEVQEALDTLVGWGVRHARDDVDKAQLRAYMTGAVLAQVEDPDYEAAAEVTLGQPDTIADDRRDDLMADADRSGV